MSNGSQELGPGLSQRRATQWRALSTSLKAIRYRGGGVGPLIQKMATKELIMSNDCWEVGPCLSQRRITQRWDFLQKSWYLSCFMLFDKQLLRLVKCFRSGRVGPVLTQKLATKDKEWFPGGRSWSKPKKSYPMKGFIHLVKSDS